MKADPETLKALKEAYRNTKRPIWKAIYEELSESGTEHVVNVSKLSRLSEGEGYFLVIGKVLGGGILDKPVKVGALDFSRAGKEKIYKAGGEALSIREFAEKYRDVRGIIIVK